MQPRITVVEVLKDLKDLKERFGLRRVVFLGNRGMVASTDLGFFVAAIRAMW